MGIPERSVDMGTIIVPPHSPSLLTVMNGRLFRDPFREYTCLTHNGASLVEGQTQECQF